MGNLRLPQRRRKGMAKSDEDDSIAYNSFLHSELGEDDEEPVNCTSSEAFLGSLSYGNGVQVGSLSGTSRLKSCMDETGV
jgi:hypothetical protein